MMRRGRGWLGPVAVGLALAALVGCGASTPTACDRDCEARAAAGCAQPACAEVCDDLYGRVSASCVALLDAYFACFAEVGYLCDDGLAVAAGGAESCRAETEAVTPCLEALSEP